jgi:glycosyltransferase involved in cell wall biosynthesis
MRIRFVVQRYGEDVFGGAEQFTRSFATRLAEQGHAVDVLTSCAVSYVDWADAYAPGTEEVDGVTIHRLSVERERDNRLFDPLNGRVTAGNKPVPLFLQREWMRMQGPLLRDLPMWIEEHASAVDVTVYTTYLYATTFHGLPVSARLGPTILHPTAHDEPPLYLPLFDQIFRAPRALGFLTPEEGALVQRRFRTRSRSITVGIGVGRGIEVDAGAFRSRYGLEDRPYVLFVGRLDPHKGTEELHDLFVTYKARNPGPLKLVLLGQPVRPLPDHADIVRTGFLSEAEKFDAIAGASALVQPSYFESFSIVLMEAFAQGVPAIVQGACEVLAGHAQRSRAAFAYKGYAEFEAALDLLTTDRRLAERMGASGHAYVEANYTWPVILDEYESFLEEVVS